MRKFLVLAGLVMAAALSSCSQNSKMAKVEVDGKTVEVDSDIVNRVPPPAVEAAIQRRPYLEKIKQPTSAASFGKKMKETVWRAFRYERKGIFFEMFEAGKVTVICYQKGIEVIYNGQSWFYEQKYFTEHMLVEDYYDTTITASESILHPGVWEPAHAEVSIGNDIYMEYIYDGGANVYLWAIFSTSQQELYNIYIPEEMIISEKTYY